MRPGFDTDDRPLVAIWETTQACDLACEHCRADAQPARHPDELTTPEAHQLLDDLREFGEGQLVVLSGGDPMKRPDLVDLVDYGTDIGLRMTLTPSGTSQLDHEGIAALQDAGLRRMALSIDGATADRHDAFRGENGSYQETMAAAAAADDLGLPLQVNTTVTGSTVDDLPRIADLVEDLGAVMWSVFFLVPIGRGRFLDPISPAHAERVMEWLDDIADERPFGLKTTEAPHYRRVRMQNADSDDSDQGGDGQTRPGGGRTGGITAGDGFMFVSHVGEVFPSGFLPASAGNVREHSPVDLYRGSDLFTQLRRKDELTGKCGACEFRHVCGGSRSRAYAVTGDPMASDPLCDYQPPGWNGSEHPVDAD